MCTYVMLPRFPVFVVHNAKEQLRMDTLVKVEQKLVELIEDVGFAKI